MGREREIERGIQRGGETHGYPLLSLVPCALRQLYVSFGCSFIWPNIMRVYVYGLPLQENGKTHKKNQREREGEGMGEGWSVDCAELWLILHSAKQKTPK